MGTKHIFDPMAFQSQFGVLSHTLTSNTHPGPIKKYEGYSVLVNGNSLDEAQPPSLGCEQIRSRGHHPFPLHLKTSLVHGETPLSTAQQHLQALPSRAQSRHTSATLTHVKSLSVDAAPFHPNLIHRTPSPKPHAFANASQSLPHLPAQPHQFDSGKMYPIPQNHYPYPSQAPHPFRWNGGNFFPYALPTGSQQTYHAQPTFQGESNGAMTAANPYDPFTAATPSLATANHATHQAQVNPYTQDTNSMGGASYYQGQNNFAQPVRLCSSSFDKSQVKLTMPSATISSLRSTRSTSGESIALPKSGPRLLHF